MDKLNAMMNKYTKTETPKRLTRSASKDSPKVEEDKIAKGNLDIMLQERKNKFQTKTTNNNRNLNTNSKPHSTTTVKKAVPASMDKTKTPFQTNKKEFLNKTQFKIKNALTFKKDSTTSVTKPFNKASNASVNSNVSRQNSTVVAKASKNTASKDKLSR
jgi:hypothetical protein